MRRLCLMLATAVALLTAATALAADPPAAVTGAASAIGQNDATLTAKVDPKGTATSVRFELGTGTAYGLQSAAKDAGAGIGEVAIEIPVQGLAPGTTYHFRVVATSAAGTTQGADATFKTAAAPTAPSVTTGGAREVTPAAATVTGSVNPRGAATSYRFEHGPTSSLGSSTAPADVAAGTRTVAVTARLEGLQAGKRTYFRLVATNAVGTTRGAIRSFTAGTTPTSARLAAEQEPVVYGRAAVLRGTVAGSKRSGVRIRLQTTPFPFSTPFADSGTPVLTSRTGSFAFTLPAVLQTTRAIVIAEGAPSILSNVVVVRSAVRAGITSVRRTRRQVVIGGRLVPATAEGVAALQRQAADGRWVPLRRARIGADGRYAIALRPRHSALTLRVVGLAHDGGAHVRGYSRTVRVAAARR